MAKKKITKPKPKRKPKPDFAQNALAGIEKLIGGKLSDGMTKRK